MFGQKYMFSNIAQIRALAQEKPGLARRVRRFLGEMLRRHKATKTLGRIIYSDMRRAYDAYGDALRAAKAGVDSARGEGVKYAKESDDYSVFGQHFGYYDETGGSDTDTWASIWANSGATDKGARKLISQNYQWFIIEQSDSDDQGYFIVKRVSDYYEALAEVEEYNDWNSGQKMAGLADETHSGD